MQQTAGQMFYYRLSSAIEAQDLATLESLYHPDATLISFLLRAGAIHLAFSGFISPRPAELKETFKLIAERRRKGLSMRWDAFITSRRRRGL